MAEREAARKQKNRKRDQEAAIQRAVDDQAKANKIAKLKGGGGGQHGISAAFAAASVHEESTLDHLGRWAFAAGIPPNAFSHPLWPAAW